MCVRALFAGCFHCMRRPMLPVPEFVMPSRAMRSRRRPLAECSTQATANVNTLRPNDRVMTVHHITSLCLPMLLQIRCMAFSFGFGYIISTGEDPQVIHRDVIKIKGYWLLLFDAGMQRYSRRPSVSFASARIGPLLPKFGELLCRVESSAAPIKWEVQLRAKLGLPPGNIFRNLSLSLPLWLP